jgi:hypothetical protein
LILKLKCIISPALFFPPVSEEIGWNLAIGGDLTPGAFSLQSGIFPWFEDGTHYLVVTQSLYGFILDELLSKSMRNILNRNI